MTTRILPRAEWARLTDHHVSLPAIHEAIVDGEIVVVEDDGRIVGCWMAIACLHVESAWIDPAYRKRTAVGRRLLRAMRGLVLRRGVRAALMCVVEDEPARLVASHLGATDVLGRHVMARLA